MGPGAALLLLGLTLRPGRPVLGRTLPSTRHLLLRDHHGLTPLDQALLDAVAQLKLGNAKTAKDILQDIDQQSSATLPPEKQEILSMIQVRVDAAIVKEEESRTHSDQQLVDSQKAARQGDAALGATIAALGRRDFSQAYGHLDCAKAAYERAGLDHARVMALENMYANIRVEEERMQRIEKLVQRKKMVAEARQKRKAESLGLDGDILDQLLTDD